MARRTQAVIMQAFMDLLAQKPYDKITVKDVIEKADINRNTFYYYYENIPSLLEALFDQEIQAFSNSTEKSDSFAKEYMRASSLVRTNRQALRHLYESENRALISQFLETASGLFVERFVRQAKLFQLSASSLVSASISALPVPSCPPSSTICRNGWRAPSTLPSTVSLRTI